MRLSSFWKKEKGNKKNEIKKYPSEKKG